MVTPDRIAIAADVLVNIGLVDNLAEQVGRAGGGRRRDRHQPEREQIAPPIGSALFRDQAANQNRRAVGVVSNFLWKFGHPHSIDSAGQASARASGLAAKCFLARYIGFFQAKSGLAPNEISGRFRVLDLVAALAEQFLFPRQRVGGDGLEIVVLRRPVQRSPMRLVSATMVMISPGLRGAYWTAKLRPETQPHRLDGL